MSGVPKRTHEESGHSSSSKYPHEDSGECPKLSSTVSGKYHSPYEMGQDARMPKIPWTEPRDADRRSPQTVFLDRRRRRSWSVIVKKEKKSPFHQMRTLTLTLKVTPIRPRFAELLSLRTLSSSSSLDYSDQSRGGLPRFFSELLPPSRGGIVRVQGDEFWHMTKVLRLSANDRAF
ncbi:hypothetical protein CMV_011624 [Castanea mollissima]|uniref:16S rRNA (uracil(1498)-N(3))-methyltransferase n=1 Tax=Castanea mollissima TaxID=60419 RepID=A0A8J4RH24_9ROSI|nr:hypothetical protein CMV_011624 [Castanea mollissima]